jgi:hypothetical protein
MITIEHHQPDELWFYQAETGKHFLSTRYDEVSALMYVHWHGSVSSEEIISSYTQLGHFARVNHWFVQGSLADLSRQKMSFSAHNEWLVKHYWPKAMQHGYCRTAIVKANDFSANISLRLLALLNQQHLPQHEIQLFDQFRPAEDWLLAQKKRENKEPEQFA